MRFYKLIFSFFFVGILLISCKKETLDTYSGINQVYFRFANATISSTMLVDSVFVHFGYDNIIKSDSIIGINIMVLGDVVNYNRLVNFAIIDSMTTAKSSDYELLKNESYIIADSIGGQLKIKLKNTESLNDTVLKIGIVLLDNEYFNTDYDETHFDFINKEGKIKANRFYVKFDNANVMPNLWAAREAGFKSMFGNYSKVKFDFICESLNLTREYFTYIEGVENPGTVYSARFSISGRPWARYLKELLQEMNPPLKDENGEFVTIP